VKSLQQSSNIDAASSGSLSSLKPLSFSDETIGTLINREQGVCGA
jgi:hypothetical protein